MPGADLRPRLEKRCGVKNKGSGALIKRGVLAVVIVVALLSNLDLLLFAIRVVPAFPTRDSVSDYERRFDGLKARLPRRGVVGYLEEVEPTVEIVPKRVDLPTVAATDRFHLAQYALAPVILVPGHDADLVVGDFYAFEPDLSATARQGLVPIEKFGHGVLLLKREPRRD